MSIGTATGAAIAAAIVVSACGDGNAPGGGPPGGDDRPPPDRGGVSETVPVDVRQRRSAQAGGRRYIEGAAPFVRIARPGREPAYEELLLDAPEEGRLLSTRLAPGRYAVASHVRPGSGSGRLDPATDRCRETVRIRRAERVTLTITRTTGSPCSIAIERAGFRDLVGRPVARARAIARRRGFTMRVVERDGRALPITRDLTDGRVNVAVRDGVVTAVDGIY